MAALHAIDPNKEQVACYHLMPSGRVIVLTVGPDVIHTYSAEPSDDGYALLSTGALIETH